MAARAGRTGAARGVVVVGQVDEAERACALLHLYRVHAGAASIDTLSLHDALPIFGHAVGVTETAVGQGGQRDRAFGRIDRVDGDRVVGVDEVAESVLAHV